MRKEKDNQKMDIDLLLRDVAAKENDALPLDEWKRQLYKKIESSDQRQQEEPPMADELAARRRRNLRKITIGFSSVAAAFLILLGASRYWQEDLKAKSAPPEVRMAAEEAVPYDAAPSESALPEAALYAAPEAPAAEAPASTEAPAADMADKGGTEAPAAPAPSTATDNAAGAGQAGILSGPVELTPEQQQAVDAVNALLPDTRGKVDAAAAVVTLIENATLTVRPLSGGEALDITRPRIYWVEADPSAENMPAYAVDADTYEVLGEIVEG